MAHNVMNQLHLKMICDLLRLGQPKEVTRIYGGRGGHLIFQIKTDNNIYCIKQIAPDLDLKNQSIVSKYELSENIANMFSQNGILAVYAIDHSRQRLIIIDNIGYLVYPWLDGHILKRNEVSREYAIEIALTLAKMHKLNLIVPELGAPRLDIHSNDDIMIAFDKIYDHQYPMSATLKQMQKIILVMNESYIQSIPLLLENTVVTHGDVDQLNVIWNNFDEPNLIDWESAKRMNPTREIIRTSLGWSGDSISLYQDMLRTYINAGGLFDKSHVKAAFYAAFGSSLNWLMFNTNIINNCSDGIDVALNEVNSVLTSIKKYLVLLDELIVHTESL